MSPLWHPSEWYSRDSFGPDTVVLVALLFGIVFALLIAA